MNPTIVFRRAGAELLGTGLLVTVIVGSGIAAQRLSTDTGQLVGAGIGVGLAALLFRHPDRTADELVVTHALSEPEKDPS